MIKEEPGVNEKLIGETGEAAKGAAAVTSGAGGPFGGLSGLVPTTVTSLYIDNASLRLLVTHGKRVTISETVALEPGLVTDGVINDPKKVGALINDLFLRLKVGKGRVIVGVSGLHCLPKLITLPRLSSSLLDEVVRREAERELPIPLDELYLAWQDISQKDEDDMRIFLVACSRNVVDSLLPTLRFAGIRPYILDIAPLALTRVALRQTAVLADIRSDEVDVVITVGGIPELIRSFPLTHVRSEREKMDVIREEIIRTFRFYNSRRVENPLEQDVAVYVSGENASREELIASLAGEMGHPAAPMSSLLSLEYPPDFDPDPYMVNIGLAMKKLNAGGESALLNLNVYPDVYQPRPLKLFQIFGVTAGLMVVAALVMVSLSYREMTARTESLGFERDGASLLLSKRAAEQAALKKDIAALQQAVTEEQQAHDTIAGAAESLANRRETVNGNLDLVTNLVFYRYVELSSVRHTENTVTVSGTAENEEDVLRYASNLESSDRFTDVVITSIKTETETVEEDEDSESSETEEESTVVNFVLTLKIKS